MKTRKAIMTKLEKLNDTSARIRSSTLNSLALTVSLSTRAIFTRTCISTPRCEMSRDCQTEAQKSSDLFMKCRYLDEITGNRGVIFATGTPISNSMVVRP